MARTSKCLISLVLLVNLFSLSYSPQIGEENALFNPSPPLQEKPMSEEENIDSFDVNPKSGRWNVSTDDTTDDLITDSQLRLITTNNETSGSSEFDMNRGMRKSDGKVEWRSMANGGGNQTEWFRDVLGDSADYEDDIDNFVFQSGTTSTENQLNGLVTISITGTGSAINFYTTGLVDIPTDVYNEFNLKIKASEALQFSIRKPNQDAIFSNQELSVDWQEFSINSDDFVSERWTGVIASLRLSISEVSGEGNFDGNEVIYLEYIKLMGDLDFATHVEAEVEDTWDWEDSLEYWYDVENNISDFNDLTTEGWERKSTHTHTDLSTNASGWLEVTSSVGTAQNAINITGLSIDADIYSWLTIEINQQDGGNITSIGITDGTNTVCSDLTNHALGETFLFVCDLDLDVDWASTESELNIFIDYFIVATHITAFNFTFLYDVELGDLEGWGDLTNKYVNPNGWITGRPAAGTADNFVSALGFSIDADLFEILTLRLAVSDDTMEFLVEARGSDDVTDQVVATQQIDSTSFTTYTFDLSEDADWPGDTFKRIQFRFDETDGTLDGDEIIRFDYILLLGHWAEPDSVIGLSNPETYEPVLNITTHFWENTSLGGRYEIELLDQSGELAYYFYSDNFTNLGSEWVRGKLEYNVLKSILKITINWDNTSRVFRKVFPGGFTVGSGRTPALFEIGKSPKIFLSTYTAPISWQQLNIDFIRAPFKEREWRQTTPPSDPDWLTDNWNIAQFGASAIDGGETSEWELTVPDLDGVSASINIKPNDTSTVNALDIMLYSFSLYNINPLTGAENIVILIQVAYGDATGCPGCDILPQVSIFTGTNIISVNNTPSDVTKTPLVAFSVGTTQDRSKVDLKARIFLDSSDESTFTDVGGSTDIENLLGIEDISQEFVLKSTFVVGGSGWSGDILTVSLDDLLLLQRDIFGDIAQAVVTPIGNFLADLFLGIFRFIADIFRIVGDAIGFVFQVAITALQVALEAAISAMKVALETAINLVTAAIVAMQTALETAIGLVTAAIGALQTALEIAIGLVTAAVDAIGTLIDGAITALGTLLEAAIDLVTDAIDAVFGLIGDVLDAIGDLLGLITTFIADILTAIVSWIEDEFIPGVISFMFDIWDLFWTPVLNLIGLKAFVDGIVQQDFGTYVSDFLSFFGVIAENLKWVILLIVFFMISLPILQAKSNGRVDGGRAFSGILDNSFRSGFHTPDTSVLGFSLGRILIPTIIIVYIAMKILIAAGTLPDFFGGLPI